jgi:hypothetical protein
MRCGISCSTNRSSPPTPHHTARPVASAPYDKPFSCSRTTFAFSSLRIPRSQEHFPYDFGVKGCC